MGNVIEKIKNFFKCRIKKPAQPAGKEEPKTEEKPEEQK